MVWEKAQEGSYGILPRIGRSLSFRDREDLKLDCKLICQIVDELKRRPPGGALMECYEVGDSIRGYRIRAEARKVSDPQVIAKQEDILPNV